MCGMFSLTKTPNEVESVFAYGKEVQFPPRDHVTPGGPLAIIRQWQANREYALVRWGFVPGWAKEVRTGRPLINARAETITEKPSFKSAIKHRRCLIPADGFYEWQGTVPGKKQPYHIHRPDHSLFAMAGIWEHWMGADGSEFETAAIITTSANNALQPIHDRMPVIIHAKDHADWLDCERIMTRSILPLMVPSRDDYFIASKTVIKPRLAGKTSEQPKLL